MEEFKNFIGVEKVEHRPHGDTTDHRPRRWKITIEYLEQRLKQQWHEDFEFDKRGLRQVPKTNMLAHTSDKP